MRDLTTGEVRLVRGKQSYLVDPRKEIHITRTLSVMEWNLWIAPGEPHKLTTKPVTTPWAISIIVPHNTAILATTAAGQRVIEGPCVTLLEYEETLVPLHLSTATPKSDEHPLATCFLRTVGNRVSDIIQIETSDFVRINIRTSYSVTFHRDHKDKWFNCENYIQVMGGGTAECSRIARACAARRSRPGRALASFRGAHDRDAWTTDGPRTGSVDGGQHG